MLGPPFAKHVFDQFCSHEWVRESFFAFLADTGWPVPINVAGWPEAVRREPIGRKRAKAPWVHEVQYPLWKTPNLVV